MIKKILFLIVWLLSLGLPYHLAGIDFTYNGTDCRIVYSFKPESGTLNDLTVTYNNAFTFYPAFFGGIIEFSLAGETLHPWEDKHTSKLLEEKIENDLYQARFQWTYKGDSFNFYIELKLEGKTLTSRFFTAAGQQQVIVFGWDRSENTPAPRVVNLPYGHNVLFTKGIFISAVLDHMLSNGSTIVPLQEKYSSSSAYYGYESHYNERTDGSRNALDETVYLKVSPEIYDTFFQVSNPVSPYRDTLVDKVIVDLWSENFENYRRCLQECADKGMSGLFAILHVWQKYGYDNGLPSVYPAGNMYGGENALYDVLDVCDDNAYLWALHTNYVDFYENSDDWDNSDVALRGDGSMVKAWYNSSTKIQSYLMKPSRVAHYAALYEAKIHEAYRTPACFLDVHSSILPSAKIDYDSKTADAGKQIATFRYYRDLLADAREMHNGPVAGEGFGLSTYVWAGYVDAIEADPRCGFSRGGTHVPLLVDYKLKELHHLFVPHGAGYLERFYLDKWSGYSRSELERYRLTEIAFGNAGFLANPYEIKLPPEEVQKDYCFLKHLQHYYLTETPVDIRYRVDDELLSLSAALRKILPSLSYTAVSEGTLLDEKLPMLKIVFDGGFTLYINRSKTKTWHLGRDAVPVSLSFPPDYALPPNGFLAYKDGEFLAYTALVDGAYVYYIYPREAACCDCVSPIFSNFTGQRVLNRSLLQVEGIDRLSWQHCRAAGGITQYRLYRLEEQQWKLAAQPGADITEYSCRGVDIKKPAYYALTAVDTGNKESLPVFVTIK